MRVFTRALGVLAAAAVGVVLAASPAFATAPTATGAASEHDPVFTPDADTQVALLVTKLTHAQATAQLTASGITWSSSGNCSDRNNATCTSFEQVNQSTIQGAQTLKSASGCGLNITGGTEVGHAAGTYSHYNGYKLDFALSTCLTNYIHNTFTSIGGDKWESASGNIYYYESNHWDVTYYTCGGC
ncbi:hypothetical protein V5P93_004867 [Actinokineospora auranticolor]|uniref:D-alanyl-D-alanine carboxypeptidase-like protein n=1 Tax=Actinokineospora auranticolor TaxID=155976 RepID=A0A2S6GNM1_9PSEU|nr:hypothetical protein [Actinokineospora auranticolor]PPK66829.1 hypothetical protein CLV40_109214 [Actinokineospora auranticolor]